jgi:hypothetical protein
MGKGRTDDAHLEELTQDEPETDKRDRVAQK